MTKNTRFAILSCAVPPATSAQAIVLDRILSSLPETSFILISSNKLMHDKGQQLLSDKFCSSTLQLKPIFQLLVIKGLTNPTTIFNALYGIFSRSRQLVNYLKKNNCSAIIACTGDLYDLPAAFIASKKLNIDLIVYIFDDYAYQWTRIRRKIAKLLEPLILKQANQIIVTNEFMATEYAKRYSVKAKVIHNPTPIPDLIQLDQSADIFNSDEFNIVYTGSVYHAHYDAFRNLIKAIDSNDTSKIKLDIFTSQSQSDLVSENICGPSVRIHPYIAEKEIPRILRKANALFLPLAFNSAIPEVIKTSSPGKTGEYLSVGRPIIVHAPADSFLNWYFKTNQCGIVIDNNDPVQLQEAINALITNKTSKDILCSNAIKVAKRDFGLEKSIAAFKNTLNF